MVTVLDVGKKQKKTNSLIYFLVNFKRLKMCLLGLFYLFFEKTVFIIVSMWVDNQFNVGTLYLAV